jgi:gamma-glutamyltranspeptidase/glutathione hydrolase
MPDRGWDSVTVPGAVDAWRQLSRRFGALPFEDLFRDAVGRARDGFRVTVFIALAWARAAARFGDLPDFAACFLPGGRAPQAGERFRCPDLADSLESIAASGGRSFYEGDLADRIVAAAARDGGALTARDLAEHAGEWVEPLAVDYRGVRLHELPPNGQGLAALIALGILERLGDPPVDEAADLHRQIEAMKIGLAEARRHVADPETMEMDTRTLLDPRFLERCARAVDPDRASSPAPSLPADHGTVFLAAADASGRAVSFIQSNYMGFGSGVVVPGTGVSLQNRGAGFSLEPGHPNRVGGGKRPFHTIIPAFVTRDGVAEMAFGVMGGDMQAQGHVQMMTRIFAGDQDVQAAADAPRWFVHADGTVSVEEELPDADRHGLRARGHRIRIERGPALFGGAQLIRRAGSGWAGGSDPRKDGMADGF